MKAILKFAVLSFFIFTILSNLVLSEVQSNSTETNSSESFNENQENQEHHEGEQTEDSESHDVSENTEQKKSKKKSFVTEMTPDEFYSIVKNNKKIIINFYDERNKFSSTFNDIFEEVAETCIKDNLGYTFYKVEAVAYEEFSETFKITEIPSVSYVYFDGKDVIKILYQGQKSKKAILSYLRKKHTYKPRRLTDYKKFLNLVKKAKSFVLFLGNKEENNELVNNIIQTSLDLGIHNIFWSDSEEFYKQYGVEKGKMEIIYHTTKNQKVDKGVKFEISTKPIELTSANLVFLFRTYTRPSLLDFSQENIKLSLGANSRANLPAGIFIYQSKNRTSTDEIHALAKRVAKNRRREITFFYSDENNSKYKNMKSSFMASDSDLPAFTIYPGDKEDAEPSDDVNQRFILRAVNGTLTEDRINEFLQDFKDNKLSPYLVSEPEPTELINEHGVYKIVGYNFKKVINTIGKGKHVLVNFCTENERCREFDDVFNRVVKKLKVNENLIFGKIDIKKNEFEGLESDATPTLVFFTDTLQKIQTGKIHDGKLNTLAIISFVRKNYQEQGQSLKVTAFDDDFDENEREKFSPVVAKEEEKQNKEEQPEQEESEIERGEYNPEDKVKNKNHQEQRGDKAEHLSQGHTSEVDHDAAPEMDSFKEGKVEEGENIDDMKPEL